MLMVRFLPRTALRSALPLTAALLLTASGHGSFAEPPPAADSGLRAVYLQSIQKDAGPEYAVAPRTAGSGAAQRLQNPAHGLLISLDAARVGLRSMRQPTQQGAAMALQSYGCAEAPRAALPVAPVTTAAANRLEYRRDGVTEWYVNGPLGLEQGFTIDHDLGCASSGGLLFSLALSGDATPTQVGSGAATRIEFSDPHSGDTLSYGGLVAFDADGKELPSRLRLVQGTVRLEVDAAGARYPVTVDPTWAEKNRIVASDAGTGDWFGTAIALSGDTAVVGAINKTVATHTKQGGAYVYVRSGANWIEQAKLSSSDGASGDLFGSAVAIDGDTIVIGAPAKTVSTHSGQGRAYVYVRSGGNWTEQAKLTSSDGATSDAFGLSVAVSGNTALVGAPSKTVSGFSVQGQAYVFVRTGTTWSEQAKLKASDGSSNFKFGSAVAVDSNTALVGAPGSYSAEGTAYVFTRSGSSWSEDTELSASDAVTGANYGYSVSLSGDSGVVGAINARSGMGAAYVVVDSGGGSWTEQAELTAADGVFGDLYGISVSISGDTVAVGATAHKSAQGQAYIYTRSMGDWSEAARLVASDGAASAQFGNAVAVSDATAVVGAFRKSAGQGGIYVFSSGTQPQGSPCTSSGACLSGHCVDNVCCDTACAGCGVCSVAMGAPANGTCGPAKAGRTCRAATGPCDQAETCDGASSACPPDALKPAQTECRAATGPCDVAGQCNGTSGECPPDALRPSTFQCRPATSPCDVPEFCSGFDTSCPDDDHNPDGMMCEGGTCQTGVCRVGADVSMLPLFPESIIITGKEQVSFQIPVFNASLVSATEVKVTIEFPQGGSVEDISGDGWACTSGDGGPSCVFQRLLPGRAPLLNATITPPNSQSMFQVIAHVSANEPDPDTNNNSATAQVTNSSPAGDCGCRVGGQSQSTSPLGAQAAVVLALAALLRARRRRSAHS